MEVAKAAQALAVVEGQPMIFLNIGEADFTAPPWCRRPRPAPSQRRHAVHQRLGLEPLRERISGWYASRFGVDVPARRIVTAGARPRCSWPAWH
jgi:aspartate/methionine/tyrosine aminotransferase